MVAVIARPFPKQSPRFHKGNLVAAVLRQEYYCLAGAGFKPAPARYGKHRLYWNFSKS
jgi:hypothetical protein